MSMWIKQAASKSDPGIEIYLNLDHYRKIERANNIVKMHSSDGKDVVIMPSDLVVYLGKEYTIGGLMSVAPWHFKAVSEAVTEKILDVIIKSSKNPKKGR